MASWNLSYLPLMGVILIFSWAVSISCRDEGDRLECERVVTQWASNEITSMHTPKFTPKGSLQELLFFLHIPRTGGRNYHFCFLAKFFPKSNLCPNSYDLLRFDPKSSRCSFISTHDDFSVVSKFPPKKTSIVTNLRNPIQRILGSYEFSIEVAARFLQKSKTAFTQRLGKVRNHRNKTSTLDIWPWKYLVPWVMDDLFQRFDAKFEEESADEVDFSNAYDAPRLVMPLDEFIHHPLAHDLLHNGATFQIAGITNNSIFPGAANIRRCAGDYEDLGQRVLDIAKKRLDLMLFVGITENHKRSAELFASLIGKQILRGHRSFTQSTLKISKGLILAHDPGKIFQHEYIFNMSRGLEWALDTLILSYQKCSSSMSKSQSRRRKVSLELVAPANFTKETRRSIPVAVLTDILKLNSLDMELYDHAQKLFQEQERFIQMETEVRSRPILGYDALEDTSPYYRNFTGSDYLIFSSIFCMFVILMFVLLVSKFYLGIRQVLSVRLLRGSRKYATNYHVRWL